MADTPKVYVLCDTNCKWEGMTKEQILTAITQAVNEGTISNIDAGFVQTIKTVNGHALKFFVGEQSEYDTLTEADKEDLFAIITNDTTREGLLGAIATLQTDFTEFKGCVLSGEIVVPNANILKLGAPLLNEAKTLTESGYYLILIQLTEAGNVLKNIYEAFVYWRKGLNVIKLITAGGQSIRYLIISTDGVMECDFGEEFNEVFFTMKLGE